jgi:hypothetical protein
LQFIFASTYYRTPLFLSERFRRRIAQRLEEMRNEPHYRQWQRRFNPLKVSTERKIREKPGCLLNNPVKRGLVSSGEITDAEKWGSAPALDDSLLVTWRPAYLATGRREAGRKWRGKPGFARGGYYCCCLKNCSLRVHYTMQIYGQQYHLVAAGRSKFSAVRGSHGSHS